MSAVSNVSSNQTSPCESLASTESVLMTFFLVVIVILTVFGNLLVIAVVFTYERLHRATNYFIVSLAAADLLYAAFVLPFRIHQTMHNNIWCANVNTCAVWFIIDVICSCASICNLVAISVDRLVAIYSPLKYSQLISKTTTLVMLSVVWLYSLAWGFMNLLNWTNPGKEHFKITIGPNDAPHSCWKDDPIFYTCAAAFSFFVPLIVIVTAYSIIFRIAITQARAVAALDPSRNSRKKANFFREVKATKMVALVISAFFVAWFPVFVIILVSLWDGASVTKFRFAYPKAHLAIFYIFLNILPPLNSCINPIIYALFNSSFRLAFFKFLHIPHRPCELETNGPRSQDRSSRSIMMTERSSAPTSPLKTN